MISNDHRTDVFLTEVGVIFHCAAVCVAAILSQTSLPLPKSQTSEPTQLLKKNIVHGSCGTTFLRKRSKLFHRSCAVHIGFPDVLKDLTSIQNAPGRLASLLMKSLQQCFDPVMSKLFAKEVMEEHINEAL